MNGGQYIRSCTILKSLTEKHQVIVLSPKPQKPTSVSDKIIHWYNIPEGILHKCSNVASFRNKFFIPKPLHKILSEIYNKHIPHVTWFDYGHWGHYTKVARKYNSKTIMGTHNSQSLLTKQRVINAKSFSEFIVQGINYISQKYHEKLLFPKFDKIISVSYKDVVFHSKFVGQKNCLLIRNYLYEATYSNITIKRKSKLLVITGQFSSFQNILGLMWFLKNVWPQLLDWDRNIRLNIVGFDADCFAEYIEDKSNINCIANVDNIAKYIKEATVAIVPIFHGSGTRIKILEALLCETPVISTTLGAEGLGLINNENILLADTNREFYQAIKRLLKDKSKRLQIAHNGLTLFNKEYSFNINTIRIQKIIDDLINE